ncbi:type II toxin-antitoxin system VapC family toxin [Methanothermobacter sp.]|uniref:type II toxin-antitoxin system VapC family toxin n=1 Tax=Methanothermobacter sp. TaxID=1884223 RepID=UPI003C70674A
MKRVLDASAFINGYIPEGTENYTVRSVTAEIKDFNSVMVLERALSDGRLQIIEPDPESMRKVEEVTSRSGDAMRLSSTDREVIGLAVSLKKGGRVTVITDDYTMQNTLRILGIRFQSVLTSGIKETYHWRKICTGCRRVYPQDYELEECEICGSEIKKKRYRSR